MFSPFGGFGGISDPFSSISALADPFSFDPLFTPGLMYDWTTTSRAPQRPPAIDISRQRNIGEVGSRRNPNILWIDVFESPNEYKLVADCPGVTQDDITLNANENFLNVVVQRRFPSKEAEVDWRRHERDYGRFERRLMLPQGCDANKMRARLNNGQLEIHIPKTTQGMIGGPSQQKMITGQAGEQAGAAGRRGVPIEFGGAQQQAGQQQPGIQQQQPGLGQQQGFQQQGGQQQQGIYRRSIPIESSAGGYSAGGYGAEHKGDQQQQQQQQGYGGAQSGHGISGAGGQAGYGGAQTGYAAGGASQQGAQGGTLQGSRRIPVEH